MSVACSPAPPAMPPVRRSVTMGLGPKTRRACGSANQPTTMPARVSAVVWAMQPAMVTGLDAPIWPKVLTMAGMPISTALSKTSQAAGSKRSGGTTWLMLRDRNGRARKAPSEPATVWHMRAMASTWDAADADTQTCLDVPARLANAVLTSSDSTSGISRATSEREKKCTCSSVSTKRAASYRSRKVDSR